MTFIYIFCIVNCISGGPVQVVTPQSTCTYHIIGITSAGVACDIGYGIYTRVSEYLEWIEKEVWEYLD